MDTIEVGGKKYSIKGELLKRGYAPLYIVEDYFYITNEIGRMAEKHKEDTPWERREVIRPLWDKLCKLFFDDVEGLSVDEVDQIDMEELTLFFGQFVALKTRLRKDGNVIFLNSLTSPAQDQNSPASTTSAT